MKEYNAKDCIVTFNGVYITGFSEDMITASKDEEFFSTSVGAQGDVVVNENNNPLGTISITLQATSPQVATLRAYGKNGTVAPCYVKNEKLGERVGGSQARIKNYPEVGYDNEVGDRQFEIQVFDYDEENI